MTGEPQAKNQRRDKEEGNQLGEVIKEGIKPVVHQAASIVYGIKSGSIFACETMGLFPKGYCINPLPDSPYIICMSIGKQ